MIRQCTKDESPTIQKPGVSTHVVYARPVAHHRAGHQISTSNDDGYTTPSDSGGNYSWAHQQPVEEYTSYSTTHDYSAGNTGANDNNNNTSSSSYDYGTTTSSYDYSPAPAYEAPSYDYTPAPTYEAPSYDNTSAPSYDYSSSNYD